MGRYTTVQAYADNNPNMRAVDYAQATGSTTTAASDNNATSTATNRGPVVAEKVDNPYGSTAGAGSGEFHVYRHARAREMARWEQINATEAERKAEMEFRQKMARDVQLEEEKTEKRRRKRERAKEAKRRKKNMMLGGVAIDVTNDRISAGRGGENDEQDDDDDEFEYTPIVTAPHFSAAKSDETKVDDVSNAALNGDAAEREEGEGEDGETANRNPIPLPTFDNDGSFLERMKKQLAN